MTGRADTCVVPLSDLAPMVPRTLQAAWDVAWQREILLPSAIGTIGSSLAFGWIGTDAGIGTLPASSLGTIGAVLAVRFWLGLSVSMTAVDILRAGRQWVPFYAVPPALAVQAAVVSACLVLPILAGALFLIVPGVFLALRWSQAPMLIADRRGEWFGAAEDSAVFVHGQKLDILAIWLIVGAALTVAAWFDAIAASMMAAAGAPAILGTTLSLILRVGADAFGLALTGATYYQLDTMTRA